jgi:hypothetical protein
MEPATSRGGVDGGQPAVNGKVGPPRVPAVATPPVIHAE